MWITRTEREREREKERKKEKIYIKNDRTNGNISESNEKQVGRDSSVGTATCYGLDGPGIESRWEARFSAPVQTGPEAYPASCTMGTGSFPGVKRPGRGANHPPHLSAEVMKG